MASPAAGVDFDRNRLSQGELIAGISGLVLLIDLWFKWYGLKVSGAGGLLKGFNLGVSATAWQAFGFIDILLFLIALIAIGVAVMRGINRMPEMPYPPATLLAIAGGLALLLILFRLIVTPFDVPDGVDVTRKFGLFLGLLAAAGITYGGWRAMTEAGTSFSDLSAGRGGGGVGGAPVTSSSAPTTTMPAADPGGVPAGKEGPGAPHPGTSTGAPGDSGDAPPAPAASDPVPGAGAPQTPPGIAGEPPAGEGTTPAGL